MGGAVPVHERLPAAGRLLNSILWVQFTVTDIIRPTCPPNQLFLLQVGHDIRASKRERGAGGAVWGVDDYRAEQQKNTLQVACRRGRHGGRRC